MGKHGEPASTRVDKGHPVLEFIVMLAVALVVAWLLQTFVAQFYIVPSGSMEPTIETNDRIIAEKVDLNVQRGDIITFDDPTGEHSTLVKRVIATGGQTVDLIDGTVYVDGVALDEPYTYGKESVPLSSTLDNMQIDFPYTVPDGSVWVMGDNRTNSADSRYFGAIPVSSITGRAIFVYLPLSAIGTLG